MMVPTSRWQVPDVLFSYIVSTVAGQNLSRHAGFFMQFRLGHQFTLSRQFFLTQMG